MAGVTLAAILLLFLFLELAPNGTPPDPASTGTAAPEVHRTPPPRGSFPSEAPPSARRVEPAPKKTPPETTRPEKPAIDPRKAVIERIDAQNRALDYAGLARSYEELARLCEGEEAEKAAAHARMARIMARAETFEKAGEQASAVATLWGAAAGDVRPWNEMARERIKRINQTADRMEALLAAAESRAERGLKDEARSILHSVIREAPGTRFAQKAKIQLDMLGGR